MKFQGSLVLYIYLHFSSVIKKIHSETLLCFHSAHQKSLNRRRSHSSRPISWDVLNIVFWIFRSNSVGPTVLIILIHDIPNIDAISGAIFPLRIQYEYSQTQCDGGARDVIDIWYSLYRIWGFQKKIKTIYIHDFMYHDWSMIVL